MLRRVVIGIALGAALVLALLAGAVALVPLLVPAETVRARLAEQIESRTGWRVAFDGPVSLSVFPEIALSAERLRVESAPDARDALAADVERAAFGLALAPLLSGSVRLTEIALERPVVRLVRGVGPAPAGASESEPALGWLEDVAVDRLSLTDGLLVLRGADGETRVSDLALTLAMPNPAREATLEAAGRVDGRAVDVALSLDAPTALAAGEAAAMTLALEAPDLLAAPLALEGSLLRAPGRLSLRDLALAIGESRLFGAIDLVAAGAGPAAIDARLEGPLLDLDVLPGDGGGGGSEAIDLSALGALVGDVELALERLRIGGREVAPALLRAELEEDAALLVVDDAGLGGGRLAGEARIGRDGARARVSGSLAARELDVAALAPPTAPLSGRLSADLRFAMAGETRTALVASLNLAGRIGLTEGAAHVPALAGLVAEADADRLSDLSLTLDIADLTEPASLSGAGTWREERFEATGSAALRPLLAGEAGRVGVEIVSGRVGLGYQGTLAPDGALAGSVSLRTDSLRGLLAWLGRPVATPGGLGAFSVAGRIALAPDAIALDDARIALDATEGTGAGRLTLGARPRIEASLDLDRLDLNPYFGLGSAPADAGAGWSEAPIDLSALRGVDADLDLTLGALRFRGIETGPVAAAARLENGRLEADLQELALYGGGGNGRLVVDAAPAAPSLAARFVLAGLDARAFLAAATGLDRIEGRGDLSLDVSGGLVTQRALMESLSGSLRFAVRDGAIRGVDVTRVAELLRTGIVEGWRLAEGARTELYAFEGAFALAQGIATTQDLRLVGPLVDMTGAGTVDLPAQRLSLRVEPRVAFERRRGEGIELVGFGAPIRVEGPWARPRIYPDIAGILQDPAGAYEQLRSLGAGIFGLDAPPAGEALDRLVGEEAARGIERLLGAPPIESAAPADPAAPAPPSDPAAEAARGIIDLLMRNR